MVGDRDLARGARVGDRRAVPAARRREVHPLRLARLRLPERLGQGEGTTASDGSRIPDEPPHAAGGAGRAAPAVLAHETGIQANEISGLDDVHRQATGRVLGGSGVSLVCGNMTELRGAGIIYSYKTTPRLPRDLCGGF